MPIEIDFQVRLKGSDKAFFSGTLDEQTINELDKLAPLLEKLKHLGKLVGL